MPIKPLHPVRYLLFALIIPLDAIATTDSLHFLWETEPVLRKPESAVYDEKRDVIYVSNIHGEYCAIDGNGFLSILYPDGHVKQSRWIEGLDSPQGLAISSDGRLFVADQQQVVVVDIERNSIEKRIPVPGSTFLNDLASDDDGSIYISDCVENRIYRIWDNQVEVWWEDPVLNAPNGLYCTPGFLLILNMGDGCFLKVDKPRKHVTPLCGGIENADGIASDGADGYFLSGAWQGAVFHWDSVHGLTQTLDLSEKGQIAADLCFLPKRNSLIIPTLDRTVLAYRWNTR